MKKTLCLLSAVCYLLSACVPSREITDFELVAVVGIDEGITLTLAPPAVDATATTIARAYQNLEGATDKHLFLGDARFVLMGEAAALEGLPLDFLLREPQARMGARLFIVRGGTANVLITSAESPEFLTGKLKNLGLNSHVSLLDVTENAAHTYIPALSLSDGGFEADGFAVIEDGKLSGFVEEENTLALDIIRGKFEPSIVGLDGSALMLLSAKLKGRTVTCAAALEEKHGDFDFAAALEEKLKSQLFSITGEDFDVKVTISATYELKDGGAE
ncbi:hypothetical protein FACS18949_03530 [Clostridia bacterium]|nr:hypothetical protein FACS18949_03530 [Clostridia bacterium]